MKAAVQFTFSEDGEVKHTDQFTIDVPPAVADVINNDKAPYLTIGIFPTDPRMGHEPEVIDLEKLYPDIADETKALFVESVPADAEPLTRDQLMERLAQSPITLAEGDFVDSETGVNGKGWPPTGQVRREDEGAGTNAVLEAIMDQADRFRRQSPAAVMPTWLRMRLAAVGLQPVGPARTFERGPDAGEPIMDEPAQWVDHGGMEDH